MNTEPHADATAALSAMLGQVRDALCGCGRAHLPPDTEPGDEWAAIAVQCGTILQHTMARLLNYWNEYQPCGVGDYLDAAAFGFARGGNGDGGAHVGLAMLRVLWNWYEHDANAAGGYWGDLPDADRRRLARALAAASDAFEDVLDPQSERPEHADGLPEPFADALAHLRAASIALGVGAANSGLTRLNGLDRAYVEAIALAGVLHGRIAVLTSLIGGAASDEAREIAQRSHPVAAVGAAAASPGITSDYMAASAVLGSFIPIARWFEDHADTVPRAGAVYRLLAAASLLNHADTVADAVHEGYAARLANLDAEPDAVADALALMREAIASIELETR